MSYAVFLAEKVQLHLSGTTGAKVCSSKTPQRLLYFIFRDLTPFIFRSLISFISSLVLSGLWGYYKSYFSYVLRALGRWLLCGPWGKLEGGKALWTKNVWRCLVWGATLMNPAQLHVKNLERRHQVDGHTGAVGWSTTGNQGSAVNQQVSHVISAALVYCRDAKHRSRQRSRVSPHWCAHCSISPWVLIFSL